MAEPPKDNSALTSIMDKYRAKTTPQDQPQSFESQYEKIKQKYLSLDQQPQPQVENAIEQHHQV